MRYFIRQSWSGCMWMQISLNLLLLVVEERVLMIPPSVQGWNRVRLLQRLTACISISTVHSVLHVLGDLQATPKSSNVPLEGVERSVKISASKIEEARKLEFETWPNFGNFLIWRMNFSEVSSGARRPWKQCFGIARLCPRSLLLS